MWDIVVDGKLVLLLLEWMDEIFLFYVYYYVLNFVVVKVWVFFDFVCELMV